MILHTETVDPGELYKILIGCVVPRPIAWVSTISDSGITNLAPFSFFNAISADPPMVAFSPGNKTVKKGDALEIVPKDTLRNVEATGEFVVNIVSCNLAEQMNTTSGNYGPNISEFDAAGVSARASSIVRPPLVARALVNFECKLFQLVKLGNKQLSNTLVIGQVVVMHLDDSVYKDGHIDITALDPVGRLAGSLYCTTREQFSLARPTVTEDMVLG